MQFKFIHNSLNLSTAKYHIGTYQNKCKKNPLFTNIQLIIKCLVEWIEHYCSNVSMLFDNEEIDSNVKDFKNDKKN